MIPEPSELIGLARRISEREETIETLRKRSVDNINSTLAEALLQGQDLLKLKALVPRGAWLNYLAAKCPCVSIRRAQRYMCLAANVPAVKALGEAESLRAALALCEMEGEHKKETRTWPAYLEAIGRLGKLRSYVERYTFAQWPKEGLDKFRFELEPIARQLWPDRFNRS